MLASGWSAVGARMTVGFLMSVPTQKRPSYRGSSRVSDAVDATVIRAVVEHFYDVVRADSLLGPVFEAHVSDWTPHLDTMCRFWLFVLQGEGRYEGNPFEKHKGVPEITAEHFAHWLELFSGILAEHCSADDASAWELTARRMGFAMASRMGLGEPIELLPG